MALNTSGNYKGGKSVVKYSKVGAYKSKVKSTFKNIAKKTTREQRFLGKTLPKVLFGAAKFAFRHPITTAVSALGLKKLGQTTHLKFPKERKWTKSIKGRYLL
jgi:hypothetical protein